MLKILIADDVLDDAMLAERALRQAKVLNPIHMINGGEECIQYFREHGCSAGNNSGACVLFLDMMMFPTDGFAVLRTLNEQNLAGDSIIVMLSGITDIKAIQEGYRLGARTFLKKPFQPQDVAGVLRSLDTRISVQKLPEGDVLHWVSTPLPEQSSDTELIRRGSKASPKSA